MPFEKVEFEFPDGDVEEKKLEIAKSSAKTLDEDDDDSEESEKPKGKVQEEKKAPVDDDDLEIEVVDDTPVADRGRKKSDPPEDVTDEELEQYSEKVRKRIQHFTKGYHDERREKEKALREREELENLARKLVEENKQLKGNVGKSQQSLLEQAKRAVARDLEEAKREYRDAYEAGNAEALLEAQDKLTTAKIRADKIGQVKLPPLQEESGEVQQTQQAPVTRQEPQPTLDQKAAKWAEENSWFGSDNEMTAFALGYHQKLTQELGVDPTSDEYYEKINSRMRQVFPDQFEDGDADKEGHRNEPKQQRKSSNVVAAATRSTAPRKVKLTQTQVQIAKRLNVPLEEYARQVANEMRKENG